MNARSNRKLQIANRSNPQSAIGWLEELVAAAHAMKDALISRNPDAIWSAIAVEEELVQHLRRVPNPDAVARRGKYGSEVTQLVGSIKRIQATNKRLARCFLAVIDRALSRLGAKTQKGAGIYSSTGAVESNTTPVLIQQKG